MAVEAHEVMTEERNRATEAIVNSAADKKLIVAGPGTGKSFTFRQVLETCGGRGLALTFIRNLVADLDVALGNIADVFTFHSFCKRQLHLNPVDDLSSKWHYYPSLLDLIAYDLSLIGNSWTRADIERAMHTLDETDDAIAEGLRMGSYYDAVSHTDVVLRVLMHLDERRDKIPDYPLVVVDEYQDFCEMETEFISLLASRSPVLIAGDDDQALYGFKDATPRFIRELAAGTEYERFALPYCSRCTAVVVAAVNDVLDTAVRKGSLQGRLEKEFRCFMPDKADDSAAYPRIIHAACSVQTKTCPYIGRYIVDEIYKISTEDIRASHEQRYPTVLVIGPKPFLGAAYEVVAAEFPQAQMRQSSQGDCNALDGYRLLAKDERSRLGWRILIACDAFPGSDGVLERVARHEEELTDLIPDDYREYHLELARLVGRLLDGEELNSDEAERLASCTGMTLDEIREALHLAEAMDADDAEEEGEPTPTAEGDKSTIVFTTLTGSKGLSAGHVFIVGFNNGHLPRDPDNIKDLEICQFVVGLSRTRKECHVISVGRLGGAMLSVSAFARWIAPHTTKIKVDKAYLEAA
jgi:hypothetical protein